MLDAEPPRDGKWTAQSELAIGEVALTQALSETEYPGFVHMRDVHILPSKGRITAYNGSAEYAYVHVDAANPERVASCPSAADAIQHINGSNEVTVHALKLGLEMEYAHFGASHAPVLVVTLPIRWHTLLQRWPADDVKLTVA